MTGVSAYPRPLLVRRQWDDLCGQWDFGYDDDDAGVAQGWFRPEAGGLTATINVPFPPESKASGIGERRPRSILWYRRQVELGSSPRAGRGTRVLLHFGAVDYQATVWVDGARVGEHTGGHTPFTFDITDALGPGPSHCVVVRVVDRADDPTQPRGKQDWQPEPHGIWYHRTSGIWQPVWLEEVGRTHVTSLVMTPELAAARVRCDVELSSDCEIDGAQLAVRLSLSGETLAAQSVTVLGRHVSFDVAIPRLRHQHSGELLWSPERPTLVDVDLNLMDVAGNVLDSVQSYVGLRTVDIADGRFRLNGKPYYLRMVLGQGYWPQSHLSASADDLVREVELIKQLGFTGVRVHQKAEDPRFLAACDRLGLLVWDEMPSVYEFSTSAAERLVQEWTEIVRRDRGHPSVVTWVPLNESWGVPAIASEPAQQHFATSLYHLTHALDPSRPVISNDGWEHTVSDLWTVHDYHPDGASLRARFGTPEALRQSLAGAGPGRRRVLLDPDDRRGQPVVVSEFGGLSFAPDPDEKWFGYGVVGSDEEFRTRLKDLVDALLDCPDVAGFCYTQLTDTEQERNGLLTAARQPKLPTEEIRSIIGRPSSAIPAEEVDAHRRRASADRIP